MGQFDLFFGTALIGSWASSILLGLCFAQGSHYFMTYPNDSYGRKGLVICSLLFSVVALAGAYADVYLPLIIHWGNIELALAETWGVPVYTIFNGLIAVIVNSYLISRYYSLSKNIFVTVFLLVLTLMQFVMACLSILLFPSASNISASQSATPDYNPAMQAQKSQRLVFIWAISSAACDVLIAVALVWTLRGMKTTFTTTKRLIQRVMISAIQNGVATSAVTIAGMLAVIIRIETSSAFSLSPPRFSSASAPLYTLTLLSNFNLCENGRSGSRNLPSSNSNNTPTNIVLEGIHVRRTVVATHDPSESEIEEAGRQQVGERVLVHPKQDSYAGPFDGQQIKVQKFN
ncbi:hypothetical protein DFH06DRAFT_1330486 [Mycena polygramma]|nr:hypothetical protein DFH06DRAFT_1330486 [Mycena polygramma]